MAWLWRGLCLLQKKSQQKNNSKIWAQSKGFFLLEAAQ
jgi:hypothetical protein